MIDNHLILPFVLEPQQGHLLCWAAVAVSLRRYYCPDISISQDAFARSLLGENFDQVCQPLWALEHIGLEYFETSTNLSPQDLQIQLANGDPVLTCMRYFIGWHLVVVYGMNDDGELWIADSLHGPTRYCYQDFLFSYRQHYQWTHSYQIRAVLALPTHVASAAQKVAV